MCIREGIFWNARVSTALGLALLSYSPENRSGCQKFTINGAATFGIKSSVRAIGYRALFYLTLTICS